MIIAQVSDFHHRTDGKLIKDVVDPVACLEAALDHLRGMSPTPDVVLVTGDVHNKAEDRDYDVLARRLESLDIPVYVIPGNHDCREGMRQAFASWGYLPEDGEFLQYVIDDYPVRLIGLDTVVPGNYTGELCPERLAWLEARLAEAPDKPTLLFMHHPPFKTGVRYMDTKPLAGEEELTGILRRNPQILRLLCGHVHRPVQAMVGGVPASTAPSIAFQMTLDLHPEAPASFILEPAACPVFYWSEETGLVMHTSYIDDFGPKRRFVSETRPRKPVDDP